MATISSENNLVPDKMKIEAACKVSLLDLPEPTLEGILECFSPSELCTMAEVCTCLKIKCRSDSLWEKQIKQKWGKVIGDATFREWQWHIETRKGESNLNQNVQNGSLGSFSGAWPILCIGSFLENCRLPSSSILSNYPMMALYISLEKGLLWFPAQVYRSGGLMIYCYDALAKYDSQTDTFRARSRYSGWRLMEENIQWERLREAPAQNPHVLYVSNCSNELKPGDQIEVQWRSNRDLPYEWWYAIIGHLETCEDGNLCQCHSSDILIVEFRQYPPGSTYRRTMLNRRNYGEQAVSGGGFYGGIRKLNDEEIESWTKSWPVQFLGQVLQ